MGLHPYGGLSVAASSAWCPNKHSTEETSAVTPIDSNVCGSHGLQLLLKASFQTSPYRKRGADIGDGLVFPGDYLLIE